MNVMQKFTLKSLKQNKKRTIVTIIGVVISVAMITAVTTLSASFLSYLQRGAIADGGNWHAEIMNVPASGLDAVTGSDAVDAAILSRDRGFSQIPGSEGYSKQYLFLREYSEGGFSRMSIRLAEGSLPERNGEVLMSQSILQGSDLAYAVGDTLTLSLGSVLDGYGKPIEGNDYAVNAYDNEGNVIGSPTFKPQGTATLTIVGVMKTPGFEQGWSTGYGLLGLLDPATLSADDAVDVYITMAHLSRGIYSQVNALAASAGGETGAVFNDELLRYSGVVEWDNVYTFLQGFMLVIVLIIVVASVSLIYNAFAMSVSERARQLGLLASVGATRSQKRASVYFEGLFVGAIGIPLGLLAGLGGIGVTLAAIQPLLNSFVNLPEGVRLTLVAPPPALGLAVLFSAITIFISVYRPARRASKIAPIDAIRQTRDVRLTRRAVRTSRLTRRIFGFEAEIALKNLKRSRKKYRATVVSLVISLVLFLTVSSYADLSGRYSDIVNEGYNYDIFVQYQNAVSDAQRREVNSQIAALDLVNGFSANATLYGFTKLSDSQVTDYTRGRIAQPEDGPAGKMVLPVSLVGLDDASFAAYAQAVGVSQEDYADAANPRGILINYGQDYEHVEGNNVKKVAGDVLTLRAGDALTWFAGDYGLLQGAGKAFTLGAVTDQRPIGVLTGGFSHVTLVVQQSVWDAVAGGFNSAELAQLIEHGNLRHMAYMTTDEDQRLEARLNELTQTLPASGYYIYNFKDMARSEQNLSIFLGVFVYGFITLISLICIANIFNTVSTNIGLRRRELAMLRSVGMTPKGFGRMLRFESIFYGLKGLLWGLPISLAIALLLYNMQEDVLGMRFSLPWASYIVAVGMILVIVLVTMWYSSSKIKKENILDALKEENT